jgi:phosphatidylglycerol:prolipoprotein diacylglycerol transferase
MIPYIEIPPLRIADWLVIQPFGLLVAIGCIAGWFVAQREAVARGLDGRTMEGAAMWALVIGFPVGTLLDLLLYYPQVLFTNPRALFSMWTYMSSYGGFIGGTAGAIGFLLLKRKKLLPYCDSLIVGLVVGWFFGRLGCTIVHDHPGAPTTFPLGVRYPDTVRHDLGFYEWLFTIGLLIFLYAIPRHRLAPGVTLGLVCVIYAPVRFAFDFLRVSDQQYLGLTPAQYASVALLGVGLALLLRSRRPFTPLPG